MKTTRFTQLINVLLFCFMATTNVLADGEPRNGPRLFGASIPLKFDRAITEKQLLDITTECYNKFVIYPFLQKISLNSNEALTLNEENTPESKYYWFSSSFRIEQEESERTILLETHNSQKPLMSFDLKPLLINLDGYKHELSSLDYATFSDSRSVEENVIIIRAKPIDYIGKLTERKLYFKYSLSIAIGYAASLGGTSSRYVSFGYGAGGNAGLSSSVAIGNGASGGSGISSNTYSVQLGAGSGAVTSVVGARANNTLLSYRAGYNMSTGQNNIIVGNIAGITTGSNNIVLHQEPSTSTGTLTLPNEFDLLQLTPAIRGNLSSRYVVMGGAGTETVGGSLTGMSLYVPDGGIRAVGYYYTSDRTLKKNITPFLISDSLLRRLNPVTYSLKADGAHKVHIGFIAQEVSEVIPEAVTKSGPLMGVSYGTMSVPLVSLIQRNEDKIRN